MAISNSGSRLRQVAPDEPVADSSPPAPARNFAEIAALNMLLTALKALSQRTIVALGQLSSFAALVSVWWLFNAALPVNPSVNQLVGLGLYGAFVLAVLTVRR